MTPPDMKPEPIKSTYMKMCLLITCMIYCNGCIDGCNEKRLLPASSKITNNSKEKISSVMPVKNNSEHEEKNTCILL